MTYLYHVFPLADRLFGEPRIRGLLRTLLHRLARRGTFRMWQQL